MDGEDTDQQLRDELASIDTAEPEPAVHLDRVSDLPYPEPEPMPTIADQVPTQELYDSQVLRQALEQTRDSLAKSTVNYELCLAGVRMGPKPEPPKQKSQLAGWDEKQRKEHDDDLARREDELADLVLAEATLVRLIESFQASADDEHHDERQIPRAKAR